MHVSRLLAALVVLGPTLLAGCLAPDPVRPEVQTTTVTLEIPARQGLEYKLEMPEGAWMRFTWQADAPVSFDMHGEPHGAGPDVFESYRIGTAQADQGNVTVRFAGTHGWFFENKARDPVNVTLEVTGPHTVVGVL